MVRERSTVIGGRTTRWLEAGGANAARTLVWLHAFPLGADMWQPQLQSVPDGCRVVAPDLAGFGGTADHNGRPSIDDFAHDLDDFAHHLGIPLFTAYSRLRKARQELDAALVRLEKGPRRVR